MPYPFIFPVATAEVVIKEELTCIKGISHKLLIELTRMRTNSDGTIIYDKNTNISILWTNSTMMSLILMLVCKQHSATQHTENWHYQLIHYLI